MGATSRPVGAREGASSRASAALPTTAGRAGSLRAPRRGRTASREPPLQSQPEAISYPGNSEGFLCLAGSIGRGVGSVIGSSGPSGTFTVAADLRSLPQPTGNVSAQCGETWYFQGWFRDGVGGVVTSNMTDAVGLTLR